MLSWIPAIGAARAPRPSYLSLMAALRSPEGGQGPSHRFGPFWATATGARPPGSSIPSSSLNASRGSGVADAIGAALRAFNGSLTAILQSSGAWRYTDGTLLASTAAALLQQGLPLESVEACNEPDISAFAGNLTGYLQSAAQWAGALGAAALPPLVDVGVLAGGSWYANASDIVKPPGWVAPDLGDLV